MTPLVSEWGAIDRPLPPPLTSAPEAPYDGMARSIVLGMPQLCLGGLSETWLLKDIGHRHWTLLGYALGQSLPEFEDASGAAVHAAFSARRYSSMISLRCSKSTPSALYSPFR